MGWGKCGLCKQFTLHWLTNLVCVISILTILSYFSPSCREFERQAPFLNNVELCQITPRNICAQICSSQPELRHLQQTDEEICAICLRPLNHLPSEQWRGCPHHFHSECLQDWRRVGDICPICRQPHRPSMFESVLASLTSILRAAFPASEHNNVYHLPN